AGGRALRAARRVGLLRARRRGVREGERESAEGESEGAARCAASGCHCGGLLSDENRSVSETITPSALAGAEIFHKVVAGRKSRRLPFMSVARKKHEGEGPSRFARRLLSEWRRRGWRVRGERAVVGVSGGADSTALLLALEELTAAGLLELSLTAAHLDHGLR